MPKVSSPTDKPSGSTALDESSEEGWFEAIEILAQKGNKYQVSWLGTDPATGKQWEPTWVASEKHGC